MVQLLYGDKQQFKYRHDDINLIGKSEGELPIQRSTYSLNGDSPMHFYIEPPEPCGKDKGKSPWGTLTPSVLRLQGMPGYFN
ncbi:MAG: hypothetical protein ACREBC_26925, partial [Pyrinomonadaceae bacterium]